MMSPNQPHFYLASLSEDQKALPHYCNRTSTAFIMPSSTSPTIAMPYVFPAADLLLANKFYLRSLIREVIQKMETFSVRGRRGEGVLSSIKVFSFFFSLKTIQNLSLTAKTATYFELYITYRVVFLLVRPKND